MRTRTRCRRRIGMYNLIWAGTGALAWRCRGRCAHRCADVFFVPFVISIAIVVLIIVMRGYGVSKAGLLKHPPTGHVHLDPEPGCLRQRTLALWLSRIALPSTYV